MKIAISPKLREFLRDPKARRELSKNLRNPETLRSDGSRDFTITTKGKTMRVKTPSSKQIEITS